MTSLWWKVLCGYWSVKAPESVNVILFTSAVRATWFLASSTRLPIFTSHSVILVCVSITKVRPLQYSTRCLVVSSIKLSGMRLMLIFSYSPEIWDVFITNIAYPTAKFQVDFDRQLISSLWVLASSYETTFHWVFHLYLKKNVPD